MKVLLFTMTELVKIIECHRRIYGYMNRTESGDTYIMNEGFGSKDDYINDKNNNA